MAWRTEHGRDGVDRWFDSLEGVCYSTRTIAMKFSRERITLVSKAIVGRLVADKAIAVTCDVESLTRHVGDLIERELSVEDRLNQEVRTLLKQYERQIESGQVDYQKMFSMVKRQLVKERGVIL